jgi:hypothetical protein
MTFARRIFASLLYLLALVVLVLTAGRSAQATGDTEEPTPILLAVHDEPVPFTGSDGRIHLIYELWMTNFSSAEATIESVEVLGGWLRSPNVGQHRNCPTAPARRRS